jgi:hypothetical protein
LEALIQLRSPSPSSFADYDYVPVAEWNENTRYALVLYCLQRLVLAEEILFGRRMDPKALATSSTEADPMVVALLDLYKDLAVWRATVLSFIMEIIIKIDETRTLNFVVTYAFP